MRSDVEIGRIMERGGPRMWLFRTALAISALTDLLPVPITVGRLRRLKGQYLVAQAATEAFDRQVQRNGDLKAEFWRVTAMIRAGADENAIGEALIDIENM